MYPSEFITFVTDESSTTSSTTDESSTTDRSSTRTSGVELQKLLETTNDSGYRYKPVEVTSRVSTSKPVPFVVHRSNWLKLILKN